MEFNVGDLCVGLGHTGLIRIDKVMPKRVEVTLLNLRTDQPICWTSCMKTELRPATEEEKKVMYRIDFDAEFVELRVGDKLICVDASNQKVLKEGNFYTVAKTDDYNGRNRVYVEEYKRFSFMKDRFKKVESIDGK
ncbi:hypothetical protein vBAbaMD22_156 [Acinetobacter phage vB_AbaM_D22]|nr:hypothetical protein vBAbaMD22_156 [Acinetobacter phage vB_AbaM_D22]